MTFQFVVDVEVTKLQGKFVSKDDIRQSLVDAIMDADPGQIDVNDSEYEVTDWSVA